MGFSFSLRESKFLESGSDPEVFSILKISGSIPFRNSSVQKLIQSGISEVPVVKFLELLLNIRCSISNPKFWGANTILIL